MKKFALLFGIITILPFYHLFSQENDATLQQRETVYQNYISVKNQVVDTTLENMKELAAAQAEVINADNGIINDYLPAKLSKIKEYEKKIKELEGDKQKAESDLKAKDSMVLYYYIGGGVLFILFLAFLILWVLQMGKTKKATSKMKEFDRLKADQLKAIEKMKSDTEKEIATIKQDLEKQREIVKKETAVVKDTYDKEIAVLKLKSTDLMLEKSKLETQLREKTLNESSFEAKMNTLKNGYEAKLKQATVNEGWEQEKNTFQNEIGSKAKEIDQLKNEKESDLQMLAELKDLFESEESHRKSLESEIASLKEQWNAKPDTCSETKHAICNPEIENVLAEKVQLEKRNKELEMMLGEAQDRNAKIILKSRTSKPVYGRIPILAANKVSENFIHILNQRLHEIKPDICFGSLIQEGVYFNGVWFNKNSDHDQDVDSILSHPEVDFAFLTHANDDIEAHGIIACGNDLVILEEPTYTEEMNLREQMMFESIYVTILGNQIRLFQYGEQRDERYFDHSEDKDGKLLNILEPYFPELIFKYEK